MCVCSCMRACEGVCPPKPAYTRRPSLAPPTLTRPTRISVAHARIGAQQQHRASKVVGVKAWEEEEARYAAAVVKWRRDVRKYERDCLKVLVPSVCLPVPVSEQRTRSAATRPAASAPYAIPALDLMIQTCAQALTPTAAAAI